MSKQPAPKEPSATIEEMEAEENELIDRIQAKVAKATKGATLTVTAATSFIIY